MIRAYVKCWKCDRCGHTWVCRDESKPPQQCPKCHQNGWNKLNDSSEPAELNASTAGFDARIASVRKNLADLMKEREASARLGWKGRKPIDDKINLAVQEIHNELLALVSPEGCEVAQGGPLNRNFYCELKDSTEPDELNDSTGRLCFLCEEKPATVPENNPEFCAGCHDRLHKRVKRRENGSPSPWRNPSITGVFHRGFGNYELRTKKKQPREKSLHDQGRD